MKQQLGFTKTKNVKSPNYGSKGAAGIDFYIPEDVLQNMENYSEMTKSFHIFPGKLVKIPSGIKVNIPQGFALIALDKSGIGLTGLKVTCPLIDCDYQGEMSIVIVNISDSVCYIKPGQKILQMILVELPQAELIEYSNAEEMYQGISTERGEGGFGSTGKF